MKVIYLHQYFITDKGSGSARSFDIAKRLVEKGHFVTVICGRTDNNGLKNIKGLKLWQVEYVNSIKVIVCNVKYSNYMGVFERMISFFLFSILSTIRGLLELNSDVVFATSTPLTITIPGIIISLVKRVRYVFEVRDLWPEDLVDAGRIRKKSIVYFIYSFLEKISYELADRICVVSPGFYKRLIERNINPRKLVYLPLGADSELYKTGIIKPGFFLDNKIFSKVIVLYCGAHGDANGLEVLLDCAKYLEKDKNIAIVLIGDGKKKPFLIKKKREMNLNNLFFLDPIPKYQIPSVISEADIGLLILREINRPRWVMPNKLYDYMFCGKPIIINFSGTAADFIREYSIGVCARPNSAEELANAIRYLAYNEDIRKQYGTKAKKIAFELFDRKNIADQLEKILKGENYEKSNNKDNK